MQTLIITIHLFIVLALVGVILIQRSEGGGLGIGGGSGFMTARGTKNALTRLTAILAACFFLTSITLTVLQLVPGRNGSNILRQIPTQEQEEQPGNLLDQLGGAKTTAPAADNQPGTGSTLLDQLGGAKTTAPAADNQPGTGSTMPGSNAAPAEPAEKTAAP